MLTDRTRAGFRTIVVPPPSGHACDLPDGLTPYELVMRDGGYWYGTIWRCPTCGIDYVLAHLDRRGGRWLVSTR